jgi:hypothetical protein
LYADFTECTTAVGCDLLGEILRTGAGENLAGRTIALHMKYFEGAKIL